MSLARITRRLWRKPTTRMALIGLGVLVFLALFAHWLAGSVPLYIQAGGEHYFPVVSMWYQEAVVPSQYGLTAWSEATTIWLPLVPYHPTDIDLLSPAYLSPLEAQPDLGWRYRHWLGTDQLGHDVLAGMIHGTRVAMLIGGVAMLVSAFIGLCVGLPAGYFGDDRLRLPLVRILLVSIGLGLGLFWAFVSRSPALVAAGYSFYSILISLLWLLAGVALGWALSRGLEWVVPPLRRTIVVPSDLVGMRLVELLDATPKLLLVLSVVAILVQPSVLTIGLLLGALSWTPIARLSRGDLLQVRQQEYVTAARALGYSDSRILLRHALPNILSPVLVFVAFGMSGAVLAEAFLSFLGVGVSGDDVSWGTLLRASYTNISAWWLAVFPGLAIFYTVVVFNVLAMGLRRL